MGPKKQIVKKVVESEEESEEEVVVIQKVNSVPVVTSRSAVSSGSSVSLANPSNPSIYINQNSLKSSDSDRIQLAQAINNFTIKSEQFMQEMKNFESFRESVAKLDILIDSKKYEYKEINENLDTTHKMKVKNLESEYLDLNKKLQSDYVELNKKLQSDNAEKTKKLESEFADKKKALSNTYEDETYTIKRKIAEDKVKQCELYSKEFHMKFLKEDEYKQLLDNVQKAVQDFNELKKSFDKQCDSIRSEELKKFQVQLKIETTTMDLTHKAANAQLFAQTEQQKKEILVLQQIIENHKLELKEQRELTKEVAQASSKSQINQTIGKN